MNCFIVYLFIYHKCPAFGSICNGGISQKYQPHVSKDCCTIRLLSAKIANSRNFSGIGRSSASSLPRISWNCMFGLFEPL